MENVDEDDSCSLPNPTQTNIVSNLKRRFERQQIYTNVAQILIAVNPYQAIDELYSQTVVEKYLNFNQNDLEPHIFSIGSNLIKSLKLLKKSKIALLTGESGSGKTENTNKLMEFISVAFHSNVSNKRLDFINPLLEMFGNAKTKLNPNSSRFCKFIKICCSDSGEMSSRISTFFLETSRVCKPNIGESNFHIFYVLLHQAPNMLKTELKLEEHSYEYLGSSMIHETEQTFEYLNEALSNIGYSDEGKHQNFKLIASILHMGNIKFEQNGSECVVPVTSHQPLEYASHLMNVSTEELKETLLTRRITMNNMKSEIISLSETSAVKVKDSLAKAIYKFIKDHIIEMFNKNEELSMPYIGIFDIAGFEFHENGSNCFEQLCINYTNERLQQLFVKIMLKDEQEWYKKEGVNVPTFEYFDNSHIVDLFDGECGLFPLLNDECSLREPSHSNYLMNLQTQCSKHQAFSMLGKSPSFTINHYVSAVKYSTKHFIEKNSEVTNDQIHHILNAATKALPALKLRPEKVAHGRRMKATVSASLKKEMDALISELNQHGNIFIRCIKPNNASKPNVFEEDFVTSQLKCSNVFEYQKLMQEGFPIQIESKNIWILYGLAGRKILQRMFHEDLGTLLRSTGLRRTDFKVGKNKSFFRPVKNLQAILQPNHEMISMTQKKFEKKLKFPTIWNQFSKKLLAMQTDKAAVENSLIVPPSTPEIHVDIGNQITRSSEKKKQTIHLKIEKAIESEDPLGIIKPEKPYQRKRKSETPALQENVPKRKKKMTKKPPFTVRYDGLHHIPAVSRNYSQNKCRMEKCDLKSNYFCMKCNVFLCIKENNCFQKFHYQHQHDMK